MQKAAAVIKVMLYLMIVFVLSGCGNNSPVQTSDLQPDSAPDAVSESVPAPREASNPGAGGKAEKDARESKFLLVSEKFGFTLEAPAFWKGKVIVNEENDSFTVRHVTVSPGAPVQNPVIINVIQYGSVEKWEQDAKKENEPFPYEKLGVINGMVFASVFTFDFPYDDNSPADQKEYTEIMASVDEVLKTFQPVNKQDNGVQPGTEQGGNRYYVAGIDDPAGFERYFLALQALIAQDDRKTVVQHFIYPVSLNIDQKTVTINSAQEMLACYDSVFTENVKKAVAGEKVEDLSVSAKGVMVGNGQLWLGVAEGEKYHILSVNP